MSAFGSKADIRNCGPSKTHSSLWDFRRLDLVPIIFADALDQKKLAVGFQLVRNPMRRAWPNFEALADSKRVVLEWPPGFDCQSTLQHKIVVGALTVKVPGDNLFRSQREDADSYIRTHNNRLNILHRIVRHRAPH